MINKYKKQIGLGIFLTMLAAIFFTLCIRDIHSENFQAKAPDTTDFTNRTEEFSTWENNVSTIGAETEAPTRKTEKKTKKFSINKIMKKHKDKLPFKIKVNRAENFVTVYTLNKKGKYKIPYKTFWCSTGATIDSTPLGEFQMTERYDWRIMVDGTYAQYAIRIYGPIMLHSIPYTAASHDSMEYWEYNKLGKPASLGCVRLQAGDIKWIYDHCKNGTKVVIYEKPNERPAIKIPKLKKLKANDKNRGWDPSDPVKDNPWLKQKK